MTKLTKRQQEILTLIQSHMVTTGSPPTRAEIAKTMGFRSPNAAEDHLRALARKGVIELVPGTSRGIRLTQGAGIPIVGRLHSKSPLLSEDNIQGNSRLDRGLFQPNIDFLMQVSDTQLQNQSILQGDYLAVHQTNTPKPNQWVVLRQHNDELVVRLFSPDLQLQPASLEGVVVGVIRGLTGPIS